MPECFRPDELQRYATGALATEEMLRIDAHVASCAACRAQLLSPPALAQSVRSLEQKTRWNPRVEFNCLDEERAATYVDGTLDAADRGIVESHLELCSQCAEDVRSLREFRALLASQPETVYAPTPRRPIWAGWRARLTNPVVPRTAFRWAPATAWLVVVALLGTQLWQTSALSRRLAARQPEDLRAVAQRVESVHQGFQQMDQRLYGIQGALQATEQDLRVVRDRLQRQETMLAALRRSPGARSPAPGAVVAANPPAAAAERSLPLLKDGGGTIEIRFRPPQGVTASPEVARAQRELLATGSVAPAQPTQLVLAELAPETVRSGDALGPLAPSQTLVLTTRPEFRWQRAAGATDDTVALFDSRSQLLWRQRALQPDTLVYPAGQAPLRPGETYQWRVEGRRDGEPLRSVVAKFRVLPEPHRSRVQRLIARHAHSHTALAALYQREGLYDDAERALQALQRENPHSDLPRRLLESLAQRRQEADEQLP